MISIQSAIVVASLMVASANAAASTTGSYLPQVSPSYLPAFPAQAGVITSWPNSAAVPTGPLSTTAITLTGYPTPNVPVANAATDPNIVAAMAKIDWTHVPAAPVTNATYGATYDNVGDPYCWWTHTVCLTPKIAYIPPDIYECPTPGTWGLTYDDGPMYYSPVTPENSKYAEPALYDFLHASNDQKANLFYIGSKMFYAPQAAQRGLNAGHPLCIHTWSHPSMTSLTNAQVVAELYYSQRIFKELLGVTPKCWRPPFGDVDDRVRSIAWQMGMRTIIWDYDTDDWKIPGDQVAPLPNATPYSVANQTMASWMQARSNGSDTAHGHITLEHELSNSTIILTETWLPTIQKLFNTMPATACNNIAQPYWEEAFVYPIQDKTAVSTNGSSTPDVNAGSSNSNGNKASAAVPTLAVSTVGKLLSVVAVVATVFSF